MITWAEAGGKLTRYSVGVLPKWRLKLVVNDPRPTSPTSRQISLTEPVSVAQERGSTLEPAGHQVGLR